jgi:hypothetical protein
MKLPKELKPTSIQKAALKYDAGGPPEGFLDASTYKVEIGDQA